MSKVYTFAQRIDTDNGPAYVHSGPDTCYTKNSKATTIKREWADTFNAWNDPVNWSFTVQDGTPNAGDKVYVVYRKVMTGDVRLLINPEGSIGRAFISKKAAQRHRKTLGGKEAGLVIYSFIVDQPATREFSVTVTVRARSQDEANQIAMGWAYGPQPAPVRGVAVR